MGILQRIQGLLPLQFQIWLEYEHMHTIMVVIIAVKSNLK